MTAINVIVVAVIGLAAWASLLLGRRFTAKKGHGEAPMASEQSHAEYITRSFREAVTGLALDPDGQIAAQWPGCAMCDVLMDFELYCRLYLAQFAGQLDPEHLAAIEALAEFSSSSIPRHECGENSALYTQLWEEQRRLARNLLAAFGWPLERLPAYKEISPGVWRRADDL